MPAYVAEKRFIKRLTRIILHYLSSSYTLSMILNVILFVVTCVFIVTLFNFLTIKYSISEISATAGSRVRRSVPLVNVPKKPCYYDYECYLSNNGTLHGPNKTRRFFYVDIGCFDGRDMEYFLHFHQARIQKLGTLQIIAFEPDPINFAACKAAQERHSQVPATVYQMAAWTETGQVPYATENGQKSRIDKKSALYVQSVDFSSWLKEHFHMDDYVYVKFTVEGAEIPILEKLVQDETLALIDHMEIEWHDHLALDFEPRRASLECMLDNFGMDYLYMINPVDLRHAFNLQRSFNAIPKNREWYV